jgi:hypothetical protein
VVTILTTRLIFGTEWIRDEQMAESENRQEGEADGCATFETDDGDVVFYDRTNGDAWIQSDRVINFADVRVSGPAE